MSKIQEILKAQAEAVQAGKDKIAQAEALEAAAAFLRQQAAKPLPSAFKAIGQAKKKNVDRYGDALKKVYREKLEATLKTAGWSAFIKSPDGGTVTYALKDRPGIRLVMAGAKFSVTHGTHTIQADTDVSELNAFLAKKI